MHISKRDTIGRGKAWLIRAIAIALALIIDAFIIFAMALIYIVTTISDARKYAAIDPKKPYRE